MGKNVYSNPRHRLVPSELPEIDVTRSLNPQVPFPVQIDEFGWGRPCAPSRAGRKMEDLIDGQKKYQLIQHVSHVKRVVMEKVRQYVDGYLPTLIRKVKYAADLVRMLRWFYRAVATMRYYQGLANKSVALANHYIGQSKMLIAFGESTITQGALKTIWETELEECWATAKAELTRQANENNQSNNCIA
jgi:hypothetical protein